MSSAGESEPRTLGELRADIDRIDAAMHALLIERSTVIDALIKVKGTTAPGAAFRPAREAEMMRRLVARHRGALPLTTAEHIWRTIIATFTHMQAAYGVVADGSAGAARITDLARFQFGFDVPLTLLADASAVVRRVAETKADLGLVALAAGASPRPWWQELREAGQPKAMAILPFVRGRGAPGPSAMVISPPLAEQAQLEIGLFSARTGADPAAVGRHFGEGLLAFCGEGGETAILLALPSGGAAALAARASAAGVAINDLALVGAAARGVAVDGPPGLLYQSANS